MGVREVSIRFRSKKEETVNAIDSFITGFIEAHPNYFDPLNDEFYVYGWIDKWDKRSLTINEWEGISVGPGWHDDCISFFGELNAAVPEASYSGELICELTHGEANKEIRSVSYSRKRFKTEVKWEFEEDEEDWDEDEGEWED